MQHDTATTSFLDRPHGRLAYDVTGQGPLVIASPGLGDGRQSFRFLVAELAGAGYRIATMDLRGHGQSSTGWPTYDETAIADDLLALIDHLAAAAEPVVLVGNSYSGGAAVIAAVRRPERVAGLVLSGAFVRTVPQNLLQKVSTWLVSSTPLGRALWNAYYPSLYTGGKPADFAAYHAALKANLAEPGRFAAVAAMAAAGHNAADAALPHVTAPSLVVMGSKDPDFPDPAAEAHLTAERLTGPAGVLLVDGAGHYPHTDSPPRYHQPCWPSSPVCCPPPQQPADAPRRPLTPALVIARAGDLADRHGYEALNLATLAEPLASEYRRCTNTWPASVTCNDASPPAW